MDYSIKKVNLINKYMFYLDLIILGENYLYFYIFIFFSNILYLCNTSSV